MKYSINNHNQKNEHTFRGMLIFSFSFVFYEIKILLKSN